MAGYTAGNVEGTLPQDTGNKSFTTQTHKRLDWVDCAKGICIILVVMLHSTNGIEDAVEREGVIHYFVDFARPFRMPDFFLISGLFLARVINRQWREYLDSKVVHFLYFYLLWATINFAIKLPLLVPEQGVTATISLYLQAFIQPMGTLWFIYLLPVFFIITKLLRRVPPVLIFATAAALEIATIETGWIVIDQTAERFVYFYAGYWLAPRVFSLAAWAQSNRRLAAAAIIVWAFINGLAVFSGYAKSPGISLLLGFVGAAAIVTIAAVLVQFKVANPVRYCGKNSIVIYLAFFLAMHTTRMLLLESGIVPQVSVMSAIVTTAGIIGPLVMWRMVRNNRLSFLFKRPASFSIKKTGVRVREIEPQPEIARQCA